MFYQQQKSYQKEKKQSTFTLSFIFFSIHYCWLAGTVQYVYSYEPDTFHSSNWTQDARMSVTLLNSRCRNNTFISNFCMTGMLKNEPVQTFQGHLSEMTETSTFFLHTFFPGFHFSGISFCIQYFYSFSSSTSWKYADWWITKLYRRGNYSYSSY